MSIAVDLEYRVPDYMAGTEFHTPGFFHMGESCPTCHGPYSSGTVTIEYNWKHLTYDERDFFSYRTDYFIRIWSCCFSLCTHDTQRGGNPHIIPKIEGCPNCNNCGDGCSCETCECGTRVDSLCNNCNGCSDCCECSHCSWCDNYVDSDDICNECSRCTRCCECPECGRECQAPHLHFRFPADGHGTIEQDERFHVELPKGIIDERGLSHIIRQVRIDIEVQFRDDPDRYSREVEMKFYRDYDAIEKAVEEVGPQWQARRGNFTRRLSSALYKKGIKITPATLTEIGNIARQHSSGEASWDIEITRDLNQCASAFYHEGSCWFGDGEYANSRCALKAWGGLAIRTFVQHQWGESISGRAWIQPLNEDLLPTHKTTSHAYVVYNGYGELGGYIATRIVAHLTGMSYKKISFTSPQQYINGETGYLVAPEDTCAETTELCLDSDMHDKWDADNITPYISTAI